MIDILEVQQLIWLFPISVYEDGKVCISILHAPGNDAMSGETAEERWRPILGVEAILLSVISMMNDPNISSPANIDASVQYRDDRDTYNTKVRRLAQRAADYIWMSLVSLELPLRREQLWEPA